MRLGICYENGEGIEKDNKKAAEWWKKAAEKGNAKAQYKLGNYYMNGTGVAQDKTYAIIWYERAIAQGNLEAKKELGDYYYKEGVRYNNILSNKLGSTLTKWTIGLGGVALLIPIVNLATIPVAVTADLAILVKKYNKLKRTEDYKIMENCLQKSIDLGNEEAKKVLESWGN